MHQIRLENLTLNYGGSDIFSQLSWAISTDQKIGLVGPNGAGKSSLLKLIIGQNTPQAGQIFVTKGVTLGYLPQDVHFPEGQTLYETVATLPPHLAELEGKLAKIEDQLGDPEVYENPNKLARVLDRQEVILEEFEAAGGLQHQGKVREWLNYFGFSPQEEDVCVENLSGGQKKMARLIQLAVEAPTVLLLDEPDNHLDLGSKRKLEHFIRQYNGTVVIISHDRYLLDEVANLIVELENGRLTTYHGNYTAYANTRELARLRQQQLYIAQQKEITHIQEAIKRFELWANLVVNERHIKQANTRRKMLERMEANGEIIEAVTERRKMDLQINGWRGSTKVIDVLDLAMAFGDDFLFTDLNFTIRHGERVGLVGENGVGKSVLFQLILNQLEPFGGEVRLGPSVTLSYYSQEHETLHDWLDRSPLDLIRRLAPKSEGQATSFLLRFLFTYEQTRDPIRFLSGGERSRLQLATMLLAHPNLLLLDEPTNNLDIGSVEVLEQALEDFEGTVLVISHDRYFLDQVVDYVLELKDGQITRYEGNYTDYLTRRENGGK